MGVRLCFMTRCPPLRPRPRHCGFLAMVDPLLALPTSSESALDFIDSTSLGVRIRFLAMIDPPLALPTTSGNVLLLACAEGLLGLLPVASCGAETTRGMDVTGFVHGCFCGLFVECGRPIDPLFQQNSQKTESVLSTRLSTLANSQPLANRYSTVIQPLANR